MVLVAVWVGGDILFGTVERLGAELGAPDESPRLRLWQDALGLWREAPVVGTGLASFAVAFEPHRTARAPVIFTHVESDWFQLLTDTGIVGLILAVATFALLARVLLGQFRWHRSPWERQVALGALVALAGTAVQWIANYNLPVMANLLYLAAAVAVAVTPVDRSET
jgi:O-antigen ligase